MRPPILSFPPLAALLLAGWIFSPALSMGGPPKPDHSPKPGTAAGTRKGEKGKTAPPPGDGKETPSPSSRHGAASKAGDVPRTVPQVEPAGPEAAGKTSPAAGGQNKPASTEDAEENEEHTDAADPATPSGDASGAGQSDKDDNGESLAGLVPSRDQANRAKLNALLPPGSTHRGVYYPSFHPVRPDPEITDPATGLPLGVDAPMDSLFRGEAVTRLDDNHVLIDKANYVQFDQSAPPDGARPPRQTLSVDLQQALYDLKNDILVSHQPVRIENEQMILTGESMVHDRVSGLTELTGGVSVILFGNPDAGNGPASGNPQIKPAPPPSEAPAKAASVPPATPAAGATPMASPANPVRPSQKPKSKARAALTSRK